MRPFLVLLTCILLGSFPSCGIFSNRVEAYGLYQEALETSGIRELKQPKEGRPPTPDLDRLRRGLALADETIAVEPSFWPAHLLAIDLSNHVENPEQTDSRFQYALSRFPDRADIRLVYVRHLMEENADEDKILSVLRTGMKRDPRIPPLRIVYAETLLKKGQDLLEVEEILLDTLRLMNFPADSTPCSQIVFFSFLMADQGHDEPASRILTRAAALSPDSVREGMVMAMAEGRGEVTERLLSLALEQPDPPPALIVVRAWWFLLANRIDEAEALSSQESFAQSAEASGQPEAVEVLDGFITLGRGHFMASWEIFARILNAIPDCLDALRGMQTILAQSPGQLKEQEFIQRMKRALRHTENPLKNRQLIFILEQYNRWKAAGSPRGEAPEGQGGPPGNELK